jgi:hypothetical protein
MPRIAPLLLALLGTGCMAPWPEVSVVEPIRGDTTWTADTTWVLEDIIYVEQGNRLTIEPGTTIIGQSGSALVVTRDATILARGTPDAPIVFTSAQPEGERAPGDWGGLVLLGDATLNAGTSRIEGVPEDESRGNYGGERDTGSCGTLAYTRIEYAGFEVYQDNELNGLTLGGCGSGTILEFVQVHQSLDDGIEFFGGTADGRNLVVTGARDDSLDWDQGWRGRIQFLIVQQDPTDADNGIEADNDGDTPDAEPRSAPRIWNATFVGPGPGEGGQRGAVLRRGTWGIIQNSIFMGFPGGSFDLRSPETVAGVAEGDLDIRHTAIVDIGADGRSWFESETSTDEEAADYDDDGGFSERDFFDDPARSNHKLSGNPLPGAYDLSDPTFVPTPDGPLDIEGGAVPQGEFWQPAATWVGAVSAGGDPWYEGWTTFVRE